MVPSFQHLHEPAVFHYNEVMLNPIGILLKLFQIFESFHTTLTTGIFGNLYGNRAKFLTYKRRIPGGRALH